FGYTYTIPGAFAQDEYAISRWLTASASGRLDRHSAFGTFLSPRLSMLLRPASAWTVRVSGGQGHFAPSPFTEETDATGLSVIAPMDLIRPEDATSLSADITWRMAPLEVTTTLFGASIAHAQVFRPLSSGPYAARIVNAETPTRTRGTEIIA